MNRKKIFIMLLVIAMLFSIASVSATDIVTDNSNEVTTLAVITEGNGVNESSDLSINNDQLKEYDVGSTSLGSNDPQSVILSSNNTTMYYKNGSTVVAILTDDEGSPLENQTLNFLINGKTYQFNTNAEGVVSLPIGLNPGVYDITISYDGSALYKNATTTITLVVKGVISGNDTSLYYKNGTSYVAIFVDGQGKPLINRNVRMNINGVMYERTTNSDGVATLPIGLNPGNYIITCIHPDNNYLWSNNIEVMNTIYGEDIELGYKDGTSYYASFVDGQGKPLVNQNVYMNINGVIYTRTTDSNGIASLPIGLNTGNYILTCLNPINNNMWSNNVRVIGNLVTYESVENKTFTASLPDVLTITLYNGLYNTIQGREVSVSINQQMYTLTTDVNGNIYVPIDFTAGTYNGKVIFDGESGHYKSSSTDFTITVNKPVSFNVTVLSDQEIIAKKDYIEALFTYANGTPMSNFDVGIGVNGVDYPITTNNYGVATLPIGLEQGVYLVSFFIDQPGYSEDRYSSLIHVYSTNETHFENVTAYVKKYENLTIMLLADQSPIANRTVSITINGVIYNKTTNDLGMVILPIGLNVGVYNATYCFDGDSKFHSCLCSTTVEVIDPINTTIMPNGAYEFEYGKDSYYYIRLLDEYGNPLVSKEVFFKVNDEDKYVTVTDEDGIAYLSVMGYAIGTYSVLYGFEGDKEYSSSFNYSSFIVKKSLSTIVSGYYVQKQSMNSVDLADLSAHGVNTIFLGSSSISSYGEAAVQSFIDKAHSYGINVHVWLCVYNPDGSFISPLNSDGSININYINSVITKIEGYLKLDFDGVNLDYLRFPGTAYKYKNGEAAITTAAQMITAAVKEINPKLIVSAAIMPETSQNAYYYGQNTEDLTKILDAIVPMVYKGNYGASTSWISTTTKWFKEHSSGAEVWSCITTYYSDSDISILSLDALTKDAQAAIDGGASGIILFRIGLNKDLNFSNLDTGNVTPVTGDEVSIDTILHISSQLKSYIESEGVLPAYTSIGSKKITLAQFFYLMVKAEEQINKGISTPIKIISVNNCENDIGDVMYSSIAASEYHSLSASIVKYIETYNMAPNYATSSVGQIKYSTLVYMYSKILGYYNSTKKFPSTVYITNYLDNPTVTVNMKPSSGKYSSEGYKYINYTTTWKNYCPDCGFYGTLLINPKGVVEGELTCAHCDADFCGVTGWDKAPREVQLTRLSESVPTEGGSNNVTLSGILSAAETVKGYIESNKKLPDSVVIDNVKFTCAQALYLFSKAIVNINNGIYLNIYVGDVTTAQSSSGDVIDSSLTKAEYLDVCTRVANYIVNNKQAPNYASSTLGKISYNELVDATSRILTYYKNNGALPNSVSIVDGGSTAKSVAEKAAELCAGLTSEYDKALALYNFVRDQIKYEFYYNTVKGAEGTLKSGGGNCCDQSQLLVALMRSQNLTCRFEHGTCTFSSGSVYGHVWTQVYLNGKWVFADPTSTRNSLGVIKNWNTATYTHKAYYDVLPF